MSNLTTPPPAALPSSRALVRSTLIALAVAALLLVTVVLPAEYGVDPTGVGEVLGLSEMGRIKVALAREAAAEDAATAATATPTAADSAPPVTPPATATDTTATATAAPPAGERVTRITLAPGEGKEVKLVMDEGAEARYAWETDRGVVNYDTHGDGPADPASGRAAISYHGYGKGMGVASDAGVLVAAFDGAHGWFWRNRTDETVTVTLRTSGDYRDIRLPG